MNNISKPQFAARFLSCIFFLAFSQVILAQNRPAIGVIASVAHTKVLVSGESDFAQSFKEAPSFSLDALAKLRLSNKLSLSLGLGWSLKKNQYNHAISYSASPSPNSQPQAATFYLESQYQRFRMPILFKYHFKSITKGWFIGLGLLPALHVDIRNHVKIVTNSDAVLDEYENNSNGEGSMAIHFDIGTIVSLNESTGIHLELFSDFRPNTAWNEFHLPAEIGIRAGLWF